jgi:hypothetical protein
MHGCYGGPLVAMRAVRGAPAAAGVGLDDRLHQGAVWEWSGRVATRASYAGRHGEVDGSDARTPTTGRRPVPRRRRPAWWRRRSEAAGSPAERERPGDSNGGA